MPDFDLTHHWIMCKQLLIVEPISGVGKARSSGPVIAFLGEYDALPGLSHKAGATSAKSEPGTASGHGYGHNLLAAAALPNSIPAAAQPITFST